MRKESYIYKILNITLALVLIVTQIQPIFVFAEESVSTNEVLTQEPDTSLDFTTDSSTETEINTLVEDNPEPEEIIKSEEITESVGNVNDKDTMDPGKSTKVEEKTESTETSNSDIKSKARMAVLVADNNVSFRNENESEVTAEWGNYHDTKTVTIKADFPENTTDKQIEITFDKAVVLKSDPNQLVDGVQILKVDTTNYVDYDIQTSNAGALTFKEGTIKLDVSDTAKTVSFNISLTIDERLIDTTANQIITENKAIVVTSLVQGNVVNKSFLDKIKVKDQLNASITTSNKDKLYTNGDTAYTLKVGPAGFNDSVTKVDRFYKKIEVRTSIPYKLNGTQKIYADVIKYESEIPGDFIVDDATKEIVFTCKNVYLHVIQIDYTFRFDEGKFSHEDIVYFEDGGLKIRGALTKDSDPDIEKLSKKSSTGTIFSLTDEMVIVNKKELPIYKDDNEFFHMAGSFNITNVGTASRPKTIRFDFPSGDNALVGAGTIRIILPADVTTLDVKAELWDKSDNKVYEVTRKNIPRSIDDGTTDATGLVLKLDTWRDYVVGVVDKDDVYFKSIEYTVDGFRAGYDSGGPNQKVGQTGIYTAKYFSEREGTATEAGATLTITEPGTKPIIAKATITPKFEDKGVVTAALNEKTEFWDMNNNKLNGNITSGEPFYLYTSTIVSSHQYYNASFLKNPIIRVKIPKGIDIDFTETKFSLDEKLSTELKFDVTETGTLNDGTRIYTFKFDQGLTLGGIKSDFTLNDKQIFAKIYMTSQKSIKTLTLNTRDIIFLDSESMTLRSDGSMNSYRVEDLYDVNGNGTTNGDYVYTTSQSTNLTFTELTWIDSSLSFDSTNNGASESVDFKKYSDTFELKLNVKNNTSWLVKKGEFKYYFPIPKKGAQLASQFNSGKQEIDLALAETPTVSSELSVLYSIEESAYAEPDKATYTDYTDTPPANLEDVTMVKIVSDKQDLGTGTSVEMKVVYKYKHDHENFVYDASNQSQFTPYGKLSMYDPSNGSTGLISGYDLFPDTNFCVTLKPLISKNPEDIVVNWHEDGSTSFDSEAKNEIDEKSIQWQKKTSESGEWEDIPGASGYTLTLKNNQLEQNGELYRVVVTSLIDNTVYYSSPARLIVLGFSVTIPKEITLDSATGSSDYDVSMKAQVPEGQVLAVKPDQSFNMNDAFGKLGITATVNQNKIEWKTSELDPHTAKTTKGNIQVSNLSAGEWSGNFNFTIGFETQ